MPEKIQKYEIVDVVGRGAMGTVYNAHDPVTNELVAIKVAHAKKFIDAEEAKTWRNLFFNEVHATRLLDHPNIIRTLDAGIEDGLRFIVMEYVYGARTLDDFCDPQHLLPVDEVLRILYLVARALQYAHVQRVIHRDLKPTNILLSEDGEIKVSDFSVALIDRPDNKVTQITGLVGSPMYMAPEQLREEGVTERSDIFSLGVIAYQLLTGVHPFGGRSMYELSRNICETAPRRPSEVNERVTPDIERLVLKMLEKSPGDRYQGCGPLADELGDLHYRAAGSGGSSVDEMLALLRRTEFFRDFGDDELRDFARSCGIESVAVGTQIVREGEHQHSMYVIVSGLAEVLKNEVAVGLLKEGECFGEMGFLAQCERTASVRARTDLTLIRVNDQIVSSAGDAAQVRFYRAFVQVLVARLRKATETLSFQRTA